MDQEERDGCFNAIMAVIVWGFFIFMGGLLLWVTVTGGWELFY